MSEFIAQVSETQEQDMSPEEKLKQLSVNKINNISSSIPLILIDNSGSTASKIEGTTILTFEVKLIQEKLITMGCDKCYLMFWDSSQTHVKEPIYVTDLHQTFIDLKIRPSGGTDISVAIHNIPDSWYQKHTHIFILTDGEVNEDKFKFATQVFSLAKRFVNINIITVETNKNNYVLSNVKAGSNIYSTLQNNKLTKYVRLFECYNKFHLTEPFVNLCNPDLQKGEFSYKEHVFKDENFDEFVNIICELINKNINNLQYLDKVTYFISFTIFSYVKNKSQRIKNEIVKLFTSLFEEAFTDTKKLTDIFQSEIVSHTEGAGKTYQQYKENRKILFERTLDDLKNNVMECFGSGNGFMSFIINTTNPQVKKILQSNITNSYVRLSDSYYNNGGIIYGNHLLPMLPLNFTKDESEMQALRQWIRAIYARVHQIQVNDERIMYFFLTDMMSIVLSDLPDHIKNNFKACARIMLDAKRFNSGDLKQIVFLTMGNKPKPMISGYFTMDQILLQCKDHFSKNNANISLDDLWYGICLTLGDDKLIKAQLPENYNTEVLLETLKQSNVKYEYANIVVEKHLDYQDYVTLENISESGGYLYPDHKYGKMVIKSSLLISQTTYDKLVSESTDGRTPCPITGSNVRLSDFIKVPPKEQKTNEVVQNDTEFDMKIFNKQYFQKINLIEADRMNLLDLPLKSVDSFDFTNYPYDFEPQVPIITEKLYKEKEQYRSFEDFKNQVKLRFDWLEGMDMTNVVIAGGFNKSIILDEMVNDIDIYIHMDDPDEDDQKYTEVLSRVVKDITTRVSNKYNANIACLAAFKKEFNLYELIFFENVKNLQKEKFEMQDLTQMKYIIKVQIIMKKHIKREDIFNTYDLDASNTLYSSDGLYMNERGYLSYRYLVSVPRIDNHYTDIFDMRLLKYYKSGGFRIALPRLSLDQIKGKIDPETNNLILNKCKFHVQQIENHNIYVDSCELLVEKTEIDYTAKLNQIGMSVYNSVIGDIGSLDNGRSIVKFMRYVQRQNKLVERVKRTLEAGQVVDEKSLMSEINKEINDDTKKKLKDMGLKYKKHIKQSVLLSDDEDNDEDNDDVVNEKKLDNDDLNCERDDENITDNNEVKIKDDVKKNIDKKDTIDNQDIINQTKEHSNEPVQESKKEKNNDQKNKETDSKQNNNTDQEVKSPEKYILVFFKVLTANDTRPINEFDNGTTHLSFIWKYENYHKSKDWYNSNVEEQNKMLEQKQKESKENYEKKKLEYKEEKLKQKQKQEKQEKDEKEKVEKEKSQI